MTGYRVLICGLAAWLLGGAPASALTIPFTFHNEFGAFAGTVSGEIEGLSANGTNQQASAFIIDKTPNRAFFPSPLPFSILPSAGSIVIENDFSVRNGELIAVNFAVDGPVTKSGLPEWVVGWNLGKDQGHTEQALFSLVNPQCCAFTFATPLPPALPLYAAAMTILYAVVRRRQGKFGTVPQNAPPTVFQ